MMKTVLITGTSRGIGLGLVHEYIKHGYKVVATCRNPNNAEALQSALAAAGQPPAVALDVASDESIFKAAEEVGKIVDSIDILINNAGVAGKNHPHDPATNVDREDALRIYNTNVIGPLKVTEAFLPLLKKGQEKKVVNVSSTSGSIAQASRSFIIATYCASKAALNMVTRYQSFELEDFIVVAIEPGWVNTDMGSSDFPGAVPPLSIYDCGKRMFRTIASLKKSDSSWFLSLEGRRYPF